MIEPSKRIIFFWTLQRIIFLFLFSGKDNLNINEKSWQDFSVEIESGKNKIFPVKLNIPLNYNDNFGLVDGSIIFWAIKK